MFVMIPLVMIAFFPMAPMFPFLPMTRKDTTDGWEQQGKAH